MKQATYVNSKMGIQMGIQSKVIAFRDLTVSIELVRSIY